MDAARIREARKRLWRAWLYGGLLWSTFFLLLAMGVSWLLGAESTATLQLALTFALVAFFGLYGVLYLLAANSGLLKRMLSNRAAN